MKDMVDQRMAYRFLPLAFTLLLGALLPVSATNAVASEKQQNVPVRIDVGGYKLNSISVEPGKRRASADPLHSRGKRQSL